MTAGAAPHKGKGGDAFSKELAKEFSRKGQHLTHEERKRLAQVAKPHPEDVKIAHEETMHEMFPGPVGDFILAAENSSSQRLKAKARKLLELATFGCSMGAAQADIAKAQGEVMQDPSDGSAAADKAMRTMAIGGMGLDEKAAKGAVDSGLSTQNLLRVWVQLSKHGDDTSAMQDPETYGRIAREGMDKGLKGVLRDVTIKHFGLPKEARDHDYDHVMGAIRDAMKHQMPLDNPDFWKDLGKLSHHDLLKKWQNKAPPSPIKVKPHQTPPKRRHNKARKPPRLRSFKLEGLEIKGDSLTDDIDVDLPDGRIWTFSYHYHEVGPQKVHVYSGTITVSLYANREAKLRDEFQAQKKLIREVVALSKGDPRQQVEFQRVYVEKVEDELGKTMGPSRAASAPR